MAAFTHDEQVEIVHKAFTLETAIQVEKEITALTKSQVFDRFPAYNRFFTDTPPAQPRRRICEAPQPVQPIIPAPPKSNYSLEDHLRKEPHWAVLLCVALAAALVFAFGVDHIYNGFILFILAVVGICGIPAACIGCFITYMRITKEKNAELANTPEYLQAVAIAKQQAANQQAQIDMQVKRDQALLDEQYNREVKHYNEVLVPAFEKSVAQNRQEYRALQAEYESDKAAWEAKRDNAVSMLEADIAANQAALDNLYNTTNIISLHYREIPILEWLYDDMRTSDHDIRYTTELLDRDRQRIVTQEAGDRIVNAVDRLQDQVHQDATGIMQLQGVQIDGLRNLESISTEILHTTDSVYENGKKALMHQRINTADIAAREWRRHKAKNAQ